MLLNFSSAKKWIWVRQWKDLRYGLLSGLTFFLILNGGQARAQATGGTGSGCAGWLCGPKNALVTAFPDGQTLINTGFVLMQGIILAILIGIAALAINRIASREDYSAPLAIFFGSILILLLVNALGGYVFGDGTTAVTV